MKTKLFYMLVGFLLFAAIFTFVGTAKADPPCGTPPCGKAVGQQTDTPVAPMETEEPSSTEETENPNPQGTSTPNNNGNGQPKITICHLPPGNPSNGQTISIPLAQWEGPGGHSEGGHGGDYEGKCQEPEPTATDEPEPTPTDEPEPTPTDGPTPTVVIVTEQVTETIRVESAVTECPCEPPPPCYQTVEAGRDINGHVILICGDDNQVQIEAAVADEVLNEMFSSLEAHIADLEKQLEDVSAMSAEERASVMAEIANLKSQLSELDLVRPILEAQANEMQSRTAFFNDLGRLLPWILLGLFIMLLAVAVLFLVLNHQRNMQRLEIARIATVNERYQLRTEREQTAAVLEFLRQRENDMSSDEGEVPEDTPGEEESATEDN